MPDPLTITASGVLDHARAEALAARVRAAVRNGKLDLVVAFTGDAVLASAALPGFLLRAGAIVRHVGGSLALAGEGPALDQLRALRLDQALALGQVPGGGP